MMLPRPSMRGNYFVSGFTLIEILLVIGILAILSVVVLLTLNPAELLRQSRDADRVSDFALIRKGISIFEADVVTSTLNPLGTIGVLYGTSGMAGPTSTFSGPGPTAWGYTTSSLVSLLSSTIRTIDGGGWLPVVFNAISSGAPFSNLPVDPTNNSSYFYTYAANGNVFKLAAKIESSKYGYGGTKDIVSNDGGRSTSTFELGTNLAL